MPEASEILQKLEQVLTNATAGNGSPMPATAMMPAGMMGAPMTLQPTGLLVRVSIPLPDGSNLGGYLQFGPEVVANPATLPMLAQQLVMQFQGLVQVNYPRRDWQGGGGGYGGNNYGRGGYGGGYGGGGRRW